MTDAICAKNGRRYHAFRAGAYALPNDEQEQDRLDMLHHIFKLILGGRLYRSPIVEHGTPQNVLDIGTGTGIWALDFADHHPSADVLGIDLSPIQPEWTAPNCRFLVDDAESQWTYPQHKKFDFIHQRNMVGSIANWHQLYQQALDNLNPGGWYEAQEFDVWFDSHDQPLEPSHPIMHWQTLLNESSTKFGKRLNSAGEEMSTAFRSLPFIGVAHEKHRIPIGRWAKGARNKEVGMYLKAQMLDSVEPVSMAYFTRVLGWSREETLVFIAQVREAFRDERKHLFVWVHFLRGQKPLTHAG
jgi:SAM-dependent methyltransferase